MLGRLFWIKDGPLGSSNTSFDLGFIIDYTSKCLVTCLAKELAIGIGNEAQGDNTLPGCVGARKTTFCWATKDLTRVSVTKTLKVNQYTVCKFLLPEAE